MTEQRKAKKEARKEALNILKELCDKNDKKYQDALAVIRPSLYGIVSRGEGSSMASKFVEYVVEKKSVKEDAVFAQFKVGRKDCAQYIRRELKLSEPKDRQWISFDATTGMYKLEGSGPKPPANWKGFIPVDEKISLGGGDKKLV